MFGSRSTCFRVAMCLALISAGLGLAACGDGGEQTDELRIGGLSPAAYRQNLQARMDTFVTNYAVPGVVVLVRDAHHSLSLTSGVGDVASGEPILEVDRFRVASHGKSMLVVALLKLEMTGTLKTSDSVAKWLPGVLADGDQITILQLLNNTSGIFDFTNDGPWNNEVGHNPSREWMPEELIAIGNAHPREFAPGASWSYSNTNYILAGEILKRAGGMTITDALEQAVFRPLRLEDTENETDLGLKPPFAHGYFFGTDVTGIIHPSIAGAAGSVSSTPHDLLHFYRSLLTGELLPAAQLRKMETLVPVPDGRGGGWGLGLFGERHPGVTCGPAMWGLEGEFPGYIIAGWSTQDGSRQIAVFANSSPNSPAQNSALNDVVRAGWCGE